MRKEEGLETEIQCPRNIAWTAANAGFVLSLTKSRGMRTDEHKPNAYIIIWSWEPELGALSLIGKQLTNSGSFYVGEPPLCDCTLMDTWPDVWEEATI